MGPLRVLSALVAPQVSGCVTSEPTRPDLPSKTTISGSYGAGGRNVSKPNVSSPEVDLLQARPPISREQAIDLALREARRRGIQVSDGKGEATLTQAFSSGTLAPNGGRGQGEGGAYGPVLSLNQRKVGDAAHCGANFRQQP